VTTLRFDEHRPYLLRLAYRLLGSVADAEDVVQETFLRWRTSGEPELRSPRAWLARTCTRLCLDQLKSAHHNRVAYVGEWLPEPLVEDDAEKERIDDSLSIALLLSIQRLRPTERAVFLLHDVFDHPFDEVAAILDLEPANCRQIASRARRFLGEPRVRAKADAEDVARIAGAFFAALDSGDLAALSSVLASDVVLRADGGGKAGAIPRPLFGSADVTRFLEAVFVRARPVVERREVWFNGAPGVLLLAGGKPDSAFHFDIADGRIRGIFVQRNPDKLAGFAAVGAV
jgi:RNA polymerase sigma-70 factor (ECF subfamily)